MKFFQLMHVQRTKKISNFHKLICEKACYDSYSEKTSERKINEKNWDAHLLLMIVCVLNYRCSPNKDYNRRLLSQGNWVKWRDGWDLECRCNAK